MCSKCAAILINFRVKHTEINCPLRKSLYCSGCAVYGHTPGSCPCKASRQATQSVQIVNPIEDTSDPTLVELKNKDCIIREYLKNHGQVGPFKKKDIRPLLNEYAESAKITIKLIDE